MPEQRIAVSSAQRATGRLTDTQTARAVHAVAEQGYVIVEDAVDPTALDLLHEKMLADTHELVTARDRGEDVSGWKRGHIQQKPPHHPPYVFRTIVANPYATQITRNVLGEGLFNAFYSGNTNLPGSEEQPLHRDALPLWRAWNRAHPATTLVVNISPIDTNPDNGSTEIWPGSHRVAGELTDALIAERRATAPPVRVTAPKGSAVIRDIRLWHRGVPNRSDQVRHMIAMVHQIKWYHRVGSLQFQTGCEAEFKSAHLDANAVFVDAVPDYLFGPHLQHS